MERLQNIISEQILPWITTNGLNIVFILIGSWIALLVLNFFVRGFISGAISKYNVYGVYEKKRAETIVKTVNTTLRAMIVVIATLLILRELGFDTTALIASAGFAGAALGFGAQSLIRDTISGIFILLENQYRVGDYVLIAGNYGQVREVGLRTTVLRSDDGVIHYIPNGQVLQSANYSKRKSGIFFDLTISTKADLQKAMQTINDLGLKFQKDKKYKDIIITAPHFVRVDLISGKGVVLKIAGETKPNEQWTVESDFKSELLEALRKKDIDLA